MWYKIAQCFYDWVSVNNQTIVVLSDEKVKVRSLLLLGGGGEHSQLTHCV